MKIDPVANLLRAGQIVGLSPREMVSLALDELKRDEERWMSMTKLERQIAAVADATGKSVYVGRKGHNEDWFAGCDDIELEAPSAGAALEAVAQELHQRAESAAHHAKRLAAAAERLRAL